jgi:hypothetical protein
VLYVKVRIATYKSYKNMKLIITFILLIFIKFSFGQDTIQRMILKPLNSIQFGLSISERLELEKKLDSMDNIEDCKKGKVKYDSICNEINKKILTTRKLVEELNKENKNKEVYFYITFDCKPTNYNFFEFCASYHSRNGVCLGLVISIEKKEKSRLFLDGPTGEVFYYEDIKRMPR